ncbi:MAG TPA: sulfurtransferase TusA family protein [Acidimicrobiales bacterium]|nr:sulfurtransferase TusA family protein [Acidimicrobiales bacterium]
MSTILSELDAGALGAAKVVDARGAACPGPLLEAKKTIGGIGLGQVLELWSSDAQTKRDVEAWSKKVGHAFVGVAEAQGYDRVFVRRGK